MGWRVVDPAGRLVEPVAQFLRDFAARGNRAGSVRSYAYALLRWWRWLRVVDVEWDRATAAEVRDFVLWLGRPRKPRRSPRTVSATTAGTVNPVTRKRYLDDGFEARTVRHSNAVLRGFYEFWIELGVGPLVNPVVRARGAGRGNAHHNPLEPFRAEGRLRYNPKVAQAAAAGDAGRAVDRAVRRVGIAPGPGDRWRWRSATAPAPVSCWACAVSTWTGATSWSGSPARAPARSSGCRPARRRSCGCGSTWPSSAPLDPNEPMWWTLRRRDHGDGPAPSRR